MAVCPIKFIYELRGCLRGLRLDATQRDASDVAPRPLSSHQLNSTPSAQVFKVPTP